MNSATTHSTHAIPSTVDPRIARSLWQWLAVGLLVTLLFPAARGESALLGALPFWLIAAPASALLVLYLQSLARAGSRR